MVLDDLIVGGLSELVCKQWWLLNFYQHIYYKWIVEFHTWFSKYQFYFLTFFCFYFQRRFLLFDKVFPYPKLIPLCNGGNLTLLHDWFNLQEFFIPRSSFFFCDFSEDLNFAKDYGRGLVESLNLCSDGLLKGMASRMLLDWIVNYIINYLRLSVPSSSWNCYISSLFL